VRLVPLSASIAVIDDLPRARDYAGELPEPVPGLRSAVPEADEQETLIWLVEGREDVALNVF